MLGSVTLLLATLLPEGDPKVPKPIMFRPPSELETKSEGIYICLLKDFYPEVVTMKWKEKESTTPLSSYQSAIEKMNEDKKRFWTFSWMMIDKTSQKKGHEFVFSHESSKGETTVEFPAFSSALPPTTAPQENCTVGPDHHPGVKQDVQFMNTSAFYTYTILLFKSTMYCVFMLFFTYKKATSSGKGRRSAR
uniref:Immunoglobulin C1-set domain-containing protein n=1 Tax=Ornithorhynchus anatinus TaxID=9258 RepID=A0A6I8PIQ2_ORNAN